MSLLIEIRRSIFGCYRFARGDQQAFQFFNLTIEGFYRSFFAMVLIFPMVAVYSFSFAQMSKIGISIQGLIFQEMVISLISWTVYLSVLYMLSKYFGRAANFSVFVIVYNWSQVFFALIWLPLTIMAIVLASQAAMALVSMIFLLASYFYLWYIIQQSLAVAAITAVAFAVLEFLISLAIRLTVANL